MSERHIRVILSVGSDRALHRKVAVAKGVSQTELARRLGVSTQVVSRYKQDEYQNAGVLPGCRKLGVRGARRPKLL